MSYSPSPPSRSGVSTPNLNEASGYLLLTIEHAIVKQIYDEETMTLARGEFRLECVSLPIPPEIGRQTANPFSPSPADPPVPTHDFWLVIKVGPTFEMPIIPSSQMIPHQEKDGIVYQVSSTTIPNASVLFTLPLPSSQADLEDLDSLEVLLKQYGCLGKDLSALEGVTVAPQQHPSSYEYASTSRAGGQEEALAPEGLRGRIVLINEDNGEVVGELDQTFDVEEDRKLMNEDKNKPVMLDFGHLREGQEALRVKVKSVPEEDLDDWLLRGAHKVSQGLLSFSSWSGKQMISGADTYIKHSTPRAEPVKFSPQTKQNFVKVHNGSVKAATVTKSTIGKITGVISTAAGKTYTHGYKPAVEAYRKASIDSASPYGGPPLPPRSSTTATGQYGTGNIPVPYAVRNPTNAPPVPVKPAHLHSHSPTSPLPRTSSPLKNGGAKTVSIPSRSDTLLAEQDRFSTAAPPSYSEKITSEPLGMSPAASGSGSNTPTTQPKKRALLGRILLAGEVVLTSLEATAHDLINNGTIAASSAAGHKYGADAGEATALVGGSVKNVAVVYIDVAGVGRRAILKSTAKGFVKAKLADGETVKLQAEGQGENGIKAGEVEVEKNGRDGEGEIVVGMSELSTKSGTATKDEKSNYYKR
ncbi:uncharacterized protein I303_104630 [Kwoniella dejecticola CBS 10117]|uniref:Senescence domain-containing protein n=1 Tax=Kwoniella dejecticola CBS 10117 TaxID=1296121 RepID=A0A1A6A4S6_9TREE|nr:uncharacterized protein I303_04390 [Kwoniella dejecticola CBS 10117]OBR85061.1 hypothetical protein I303_04390 [Kwoniella dejecticola CBS 10117]